MKQETWNMLAKKADCGRVRLRVNPNIKRQDNEGY
jgi:hypothetical protein